MAEQVKQKPGLTGNQLKILAMLAMTCDHVGLELLPGIPLLRIIGRLALPIYAYMIAEGCRYTHDRKGYLLRLLTLGALCQGVYFFVMGSLYMGILITFSLSVGLIWLFDKAVQRKDLRGNLVGALGLAAVVFLTTVLPSWLPGTDYAVDYGLWGVLLPVAAYFFGKPGAAIGVVILAFSLGGFQWWSLGSIPLLLCYNGQRGRWKIGKLFYIYYPAHLVLIYLISLLLRGK